MKKITKIQGDMEYQGSDRIYTCRNCPIDGEFCRRIVSRKKENCPHLFQISKTHDNKYCRFCGHEEPYTRKFNCPKCGKKGLDGGHTMYTILCRYKNNSVRFITDKE